MTVFFKATRNEHLLTGCQFERQKHRNCVSDVGYEVRASRKVIGPIHPDDEGGWLR